MKEKQFSLIVIPHQSGKQRTLTLSKRAFKILSIAVPAFIVLLVTVLVDYIAMNGTRQKYKDLSIAYAKQEDTLEQYQASVDALENTISEFEEYRTKLNIMAGLRSEEPLEGEPGVGGPGSDQVIAAPNSVRDLGRLQDLQIKAESIESNFTNLSRFWENLNTELAQTPSIAPTRGYISSAYAYRDDPFTGQRAFHPGIDIATQPGNPIFATADGIVTSTKWDKTGGRTVKISHPKTGYVTVYCHMSEFKSKPGQKVKRGDVIGLIGKTGRARGPHVHYEVRLNGKRLNPWNFMLDF